MNITEEELKEAIDEILKLNPKPGGNVDDSYTGPRAQQVVPDFFCWKLKTANPYWHCLGFRPRTSYQQTLCGYAPESSRQKFPRKQRSCYFCKTKTGLGKMVHWGFETTSKHAAEHHESHSGIQEEYFVEGDETKLKPMVLKNIAEKTGLDISTISRVVNSKYIQTHFGIYSLNTSSQKAWWQKTVKEVSTGRLRIFWLKAYAGGQAQTLTDEELVSSEWNRLQVASEPLSNTANRTSPSHGSGNKSDMKTHIHF